jgi:hypothetical protein
LDQFMRHFSRIEAVSESFIKQCRESAVSIVNDTEDHNLLKESYK